jgi:2-C-methyl-D-erythritol 4-phosphate cytidylyltransferase
VAIALILAAGRGERLGAEMPKALVQLGGRPLLQWSLQTLQALPAIERIVLAMPPGIPAPAGVIAVPGGAVRSESVRLALTAAFDGPGEDLVLVHDAARPLLTADLAQRVISAAREPGVDCAIAATELTDTVKRTDGQRTVSETLDRSGLWAVQTPQVFHRNSLESALDVPDDVLAKATDDAWLIERAGGRVVVVPSSPENLKVTTPLDLKLAHMLLGEH